MFKHRSAFTLVELLIVVAIIAILAAIAVPNFLEAQMHSKVSRVYAEMRTIAVAIESYAVVNKQIENIYDGTNGSRSNGDIWWSNKGLTTGSNL